MYVCMYICIYVSIYVFETFLGQFFEFQHIAIILYDKETEIKNLLSFTYIHLHVFVLQLIL
jgi:hypothetical protein